MHDEELEDVLFDGFECDDDEEAEIGFSPPITLLLGFLLAVGVVGVIVGTLVIAAHPPWR
jgi:hypothetical protein